MVNRLNYYWRVFATGLSFSVFGIGGLILTLIFFPLLNLLPGPRQKKILRARWLIYKSFSAFIHMMAALGIMTYEVKGLERLNRPGLLILANHPTLIDVVLLISLIKNANCIVKDALFRNPFTWGPIYGSNYISNANGETLFEECVNTLKSGSALVIFPEGTRSVPDEELKLQRGAANLAIRGERDITPVAITCRPSTLTKGQKWYQIPNRPFHITLHIAEDIAIKSFTEQFTPSLAARKLTAQLKLFFTEETNKA